MISFSGALDPGAARMLGDYQLATVVKAKKSHARAGKAVKLISATYDPSGHTVTLTPRGKVPASPLQLTIIAAKTLDAEGRPIDGDHDGQPGGNFQTTLRKAATRAALAPPIGLAGRVIDALLGGGHADTISLLPYGQRGISTIADEDPAPGGRAEHPTEGPVSPTPPATRYTRYPLTDGDRGFRRPNRKRHKSSSART